MTSSYFTKCLLVLFFVLFTKITYADWIKLNTNINDDLSGIVVRNDTAMVSGKKGLYYTTSINEENTWKRFNIQGNSEDAILYNQTQFYHCYSAPQTGGYEIYACGQDTVNSKAVIIYVNLKDLSHKIIYVGESNSTLNHIGFRTYNKYIAVGNNGLMVDFNQTSANKIATNFSYDLNSISFYGVNFSIAAKDAFITGSIANTNNPSTQFKVLASEGSIFTSTINLGSSTYYTVGNGYYQNIGLNITELKKYDFGHLNARCITRKPYANLVGTDHGIFRSYGDGGPLEWQPSSNKYQINDFWNIDISKKTDIYACGDNGVILYTSDLGGYTKPFVNVTSEGGCSGGTTSINVETGSSYLCNWILNGKSFNAPCKSFNYKFDSIGLYTIQYIGTNEQHSDTSIYQFRIVEEPTVNLQYTVSDRILCQEEPITVKFSNSYPNVYYSLMNYNTSFGQTPTGGNGPISMTSKPINRDSKFYIKAISTLAQCFKNSKDTIDIKVEHTKADFHVGDINIQQKEPASFYQKAKEANNYKWTFSSKDKDSISNDVNPITSFSKLGQTSVELVCWSDAGCYDTIRKNGPFIYTLPNQLDSCWVNVNNGEDPAWEGYYYPDISQLSLSKSGFLTCGYFNNVAFASQHGDSLYIPNKGGGYVAKYDKNGTIKWWAHTDKKTQYREVIKSVVEDKQGNIYIAGNARNHFIDNKGDSIYIGKYTFHDNFIIKLDSQGRRLWYITTNNFTPEKLYLDKSDNLMVTGLISNSRHEISYNGEIIDSIPSSNYERNYAILKLSGEGKIIWNIDMNLRSVNGSGIDKIGFDALNNFYVLGLYEQVSYIYSTDNKRIDTLHYKPSSTLGTQIFVAKFNSSGIAQWKTRSYSRDKPIGSIRGYDMKVDNLGNCYITGRNDCNTPNHNQVFVNSDGSQFIESTGGYYLIKVNTDGICQFIIGANYSYYGFGLSMDLKDDEISVFGYLQDSDESSVTSNFWGLNNTSITMQFNRSEYFLAIYDTTGNLLRIYKNGNNDEVINLSESSTLYKTDDNDYLLSLNINFMHQKYDYQSFGSIIHSANEIDGTISKFKGDCGIVYYPVLTEINTKQFETYVKVFPNPTVDVLNVKANANYQNLIFELYDIQGRIIIQKEIFNNDKIDVKFLNSGMYLYRVIIDGLVHSGKIIKN